MSAPASATEDDFVRALSAEYPAGPFIFGGRRVGGDAALADLGLVDGSTVWLGEAGPELPPLRSLGPRVQFETGVNAGLSFKVTTAGVSVGRRADNDIRLAGDNRVSGHHCRLTLVLSEDGAPTGLLVEDLGSKNGVLIDGERITGPRRVAPGGTFRILNSTIRFAVDEALPLSLMRDSDGTTKVIAQKRLDLHPLPEKTEVDWPAKPPERKAPRFPIAAMVVPLLLGPVFFLMTRNLATLMFVLMTPAMGIANYFLQRRDQQSDEGQARATYETRMQAAQARIDDACARERQAHHLRAPSVVEAIEAARVRNGRLWQRRRSDDDFLEIRIGTADRAPALVSVRTPSDESGPRIPELREDAISINLVGVGVLGVSGPRSDARATVRALLAECAAFHDPTVLKVAALAAPGGGEEYEWARWLPHTAAGQVRVLSDSRGDAGRVLAAYADQIKELRARMGDARAATFANATLLVIEDHADLDPDVVARVLEHGPQVGVFAIVVEDRRETLPPQCRAAVNLSPSGGFSGARVELPGNITIDDVTAVQASLQATESAARSLAPLRPALEEAGDDTRVPDLLRFSEIYGDVAFSAEALRARWMRDFSDWTASYASTATIGRGAAGDIEVDLKQTPHCIVGGTVGAGKSQFLITLVTALAADHSPEDLNFVLVDFKGGGAFLRCADLPHTVALVTNLTGGVVRTFEALNAEKERRSRVFQQFSSDIEKYELARRQDPSVGPKEPRLVIVFDEFAEFISDHGDDVIGILESITALGRSLGMHMILGTQSPSLTIKPKIAALVDFRIALRVKDPTESQNIIQVPDAAHLPLDPRGRAYRKRGNDLDLFQVATLSLPRPGQLAEPELALTERPWGTLLSPPQAAGGPVASDNAASELDEVVEAIAEAGVGVPVASSPVLPLLPASIPLGSLNGPDRVAAIWMEDHLKDQEQVARGWDPRSGNLLIVGNPGSGRTSALRTLAVALADVDRVGEVHVHGLDFEGSLTHLEVLPHVGVVASSQDLYRTLSLITWITGEIDRRKRLFNEYGVGSLADLIERGVDAPPQIVVLLDRWEVASDPEQFPDLIGVLKQCFKDGPSRGISFAITSELGRAHAITASMARVIALRLGERSNYVALLGQAVSGALEPTPIINDGAGFTTYVRPDGTGALASIQVAHVGATPAVGDQIRAVAAMGAERGPSILRAPHMIAPLPDECSVMEALALLSGAERPLTIPLGIGGDDLSPFLHDLDQENAVVITGPKGSGRTTTLRGISAWLDAREVPNVLVVSRSTQRRSGIPNALLHEHCTAAWLEDLDPGVVLLIDEVTDLADDAQAVLARQVKVDAGRRLIVSLAPDTVLGIGAAAYSEIAKVIRGRGVGVVLDPSADVVQALGAYVSKTWCAALARRPGRGIAVGLEGDRAVQTLVP